MDGGTVSDSLIRVDALAGLLAIEEVDKHGLDLGDTSGTTDQDDLIDLALGDLGITHDLLDWLHALTEVVHVQVFETGTGDGGVEINTLKERIDLDVGLSGGGESTLSTLASCTETAEGTLVGGDVLTVLFLELGGTELFL